MKRNFALAFTLALATLAIAADKPTSPSATQSVAAPAPAVPDSLARQLWRSQSTISATQLSLERTAEWKAAESAKQSMQAVMVEWGKVCGKDFQPGADDKGEPICQDRPKPPTPTNPAVGTGRGK